ncbi:hypothetical protein [Alkalihalobacillus sp. MEB130]|uniref:hypothetical protein n=1 Tax=Alkalihalobacillus sp. MEB130 TaxID=2976704 RepID=UPI0037BE699A
MSKFFSVYMTTTDFYYIQTDLLSDDEYVAFLQKNIDKSLFSMDTILHAVDQIITLSKFDNS